MSDAFEGLSTRAINQLFKHGGEGKTVEEARLLAREAITDGSIKNWRQCGKKTMNEIEDWAFDVDEEESCGDVGEMAENGEKTGGEGIEEEVVEGEGEKGCEAAEDATDPWEGAIRCGDCRAFHCLDGETGLGECRLHPPRKFAGFGLDKIECEWPTVQADDWCLDCSRMAHLLPDNVPDDEFEPVVEDCIDELWSDDEKGCFTDEGASAQRLLAIIAGHITDVGESAQKQLESIEEKKRSWLGRIVDRVFKRVE